MNSSRLNASFPLKYWLVAIGSVVIAVIFQYAISTYQSPISRSLLSYASNDGVANQVGAFIPGASGANIRVAILDSGLSASHDAIKNVIETLDFTSDGTSDDKLGHGTFVSAVISGSSSACPGLAPDANLHIYRVFTTDQTSYTAWFLDALNYALWAGVDVLNLSVGGPDHNDAPFLEKISELCSAGIVIVSAVGNDGPLYGTHFNPADLACVIGVGGLNQDGSIASFSARGMTLSELHSNGIGRIKPDIVTLADRVQAAASNGFCRTLSGTSVASPIVAGAVALLLSSLPSSSPLRNPAAIKQSLMESAERLPDISMFEQGAGKMNIKAAGELLQSMKPHVSSSPSKIDFTDCPYFGPYCSQPLYADSEPVAVNVTILNSVSVASRIESVLFTQDDRPQPQLDVRFSYPSILWPWSGWIAVHIGVIRNVDEEIVSGGDIKLVIRSGERLDELLIPLKCRIIPTPPRSKRVLWDQYHNVQFPLAFVPRDNLNEKVDTLDWHGDHLYTNFRSFYAELRSAGFFIEILTGDLTCFIADRYGTLMIVDPERAFAMSEIAKLQEDIQLRGLSLVLIADWFNVHEIQNAQFFDKNTQNWWKPLTGGSNIPSINDLLRPYGIELSDDVVDGVFRIEGRPVSVHSGSSLKRFPVGGELILTSSLSSAPSRYEVAIGGLLTLENSRIAVFGDSNGIDDAQSNAATRSDWLILLLLKYTGSGVIPEKLKPGLTTVFDEYDIGGKPPEHLDTISLDVPEGLCHRLWRIPVPFHVDQESNWPFFFIIMSAIIVALLLLFLLSRLHRQFRFRTTWLPISTTEENRILDRRK